MTVTVKEAIQKGERLIAVPSRMILLLSVAIPVLLLVTGSSWRSILLFPAGILLSILYTVFATSRWKIWAYSHVNDIHQLQRSAELAALLTRKSHERTESFLRERFNEEHFFIDDPSISAETAIYGNDYFSKAKEPEIALSDGGIYINGEGFIEWSEVENERVAWSSHSSVDAGSGIETSGSSTQCFRFECAAGRFDTPLSSLKISAWELDLLLYIYRGRFEMTQRI